MVVLDPDEVPLVALDQLVLIAERVPDAGPISVDARLVENSDVALVAFSRPVCADHHALLAL